MNGIDCHAAQRADWVCDALPAGDPANEPGDRPVRWR